MSKFALAIEPHIGLSRRQHCLFQAIALALDHLDGLAGEAKRQVVAALMTTIGHDQRVTLRQAELLRAICAGIHVPMPAGVAGVD